MHSSCNFLRGGDIPECDTSMNTMKWINVHLNKLDSIRFRCALIFASNVNEPILMPCVGGGEMYRVGGQTIYCQLSWIL